MKILWSNNPLATVVELDENDKELLLKANIEHLTDALQGVNMFLQDGKPKRLTGHFVEALTGWHAGDCTSHPATCVKCHSEDILGFSTIDGLSKSMGHHLFKFFHENENATIYQAIEHFKHYKPTATWDGWEQYADRWKQDAERLYYWLIKYQVEHFQEET